MLKNDKEELINLFIYIIKRSTLFYKEEEENKFELI
jgi:hypothetical protein